MSSSLMPLASQRSTSETAIRVPRMHGFPKRTSGFRTMSPASPSLGPSGFIASGSQNLVEPLQFLLSHVDQDPDPFSGGLMRFEPLSPPDDPDENVAVVVYRVDHADPASGPDAEEAEEVEPRLVAERVPVAARISYQFLDGLTNFDAQGPVRWI